MNNILIIAKKEWRNYFNSPVGFVFAGLMMLVANWVFWGDVFLIGMADIKPLMLIITYLFSLFIPAISMGLIADEKKNGNWEMLMSLPINETEIVLGKMLGCSLYLLFTITLSLPTLVSMYFLGRPELGVTVSAYIGLILLGVSYLSVGVFMSSLSNQSIVGFLGSSVFLILNSLMANGTILARIPTSIKSTVEGLSLLGRVGKFGDGLITLSDVLFFVSFIGVFVVLTIVSLKSNDK